MANGTNGHRLAYIILASLLTASLALSGFMARELWLISTAVAGIQANRFTSADALGMERSFNNKIMQVLKAQEDLALTVARLPPTAFQERMRHLELELARRYGFKPPDTGGD